MKDWPVFNDQAGVISSNATPGQSHLGDYTLEWIALRAAVDPATVWSIRAPQAPAF
jgi:hypothetical protein